MQHGLGIHGRVLDGVPLPAYAVERPQVSTHRRIGLCCQGRVHSSMSAAGGGVQALVGEDRGECFADTVIQQLVSPFGVKVDDVAAEAI